MPLPYLGENIFTLKILWNEEVKAVMEHAI